VTAFAIILYAFTFWLGVYLLRRNPAEARVRNTAFGLLAYTLLIAAEVVEAQTGRGAALLPALFWTGALITFLPEDGPLAQRRMAGLRLFVQTPAVILVSAFDGAWTLALEVVALLVMAVVFAPVVWQTLRSQTGPLWRLLALATISFGLAMAAWIAARESWPDWWVAAIGLDLLLFGYCIAALDALDQGESLLPDLIRSLDASMLAAIVFALPALLTIWLSTGWTAAMALLLLVTVGIAIGVQVYGAEIASTLDRLAFAAMPQVRQARAELRAAAEALPKLDANLDVTAMAPEEFVHLTRRALSNMGNLPRLATSPLTRMEAVQRRAAKQGDGDHTLARAAALKSLLTEAILQLKPAGDNGFGVSDEWRHYNALYFPYVLGLKPYSRRNDDHGVDSEDRAAQEALAWFRAQVPERTLHNWQNSAAQLVARYLLDLESRQNWQ
jgi:hypothetical protein